MEINHKLSLYITYYLSRYDTKALDNLGYSSWKDAFSDISEKMEVNIHSVKNWRDEFDPIHGFRAGWHQRPMSPSRKRVVRALEGLTEEEIRNIVIDILNGTIKEDPVNLEELLNIVSEKMQEDNSSFILRGITGKKAEVFFIEHHKMYSKPINGTLIDTRDKGCGYDFEIINKNSHYIEVKGITDESGGVLLTNKEWEVAKRAKDKYYLAVVTNLNNKPEITFIQNPASKLKPNKNFVTTIQIHWNISSGQLQEQANYERNNKHT